MTDEKKDQLNEQKINEIKGPKKIYESDSLYHSENGQQRNKNFSLQYKIEDSTPPTVSASSNDEGNQ